jgi:hypothetical protein
MSMKAFHALTTLILGLAIGGVWLRTFWNDARSVPAVILGAPLAAGVLGLSHWIAYDFSLGHWAGDFSLVQAAFNVAVTTALLYRRGAGLEARPARELA